MLGSLTLHFSQCGVEKLKEFNDTLDKAHAWLKLTQIPENPLDHHKYYRQMSRVGSLAARIYQRGVVSVCKDNTNLLQGGFPFSTRDCGWIVADCTADGLKAVMTLQENCDFLSQKISQEKIFQAVDVVSLCPSLSCPSFYVLQ